MNERKAIELYDKFTELRNRKEYKLLTKEVFHEYGIDTLHDLSRHLRKYGEYGGAVKFSFSEELVLMPFHNDLMNSWLKFDNSRVQDIYEKLYPLLQDRYPNSKPFDRTFFRVEEDILKHCWSMPMMDTRILEAPIAGCWDKMEIQAAFLRTKGYEVKRYCFHSGMAMRGHTFVLYNDGKTWNTCLDLPIPVKNKDLNKLCELIFSVLKRIPFLAQGETCELIEFDSPYAGMPALDYVKLIEDGTVRIRRKRNERKA